MKMTNQHYDIGKWIVLVFLPALAVLFNGLGELYNLLDTQTIVTTINLVAVFLGSILQISSKQYNDHNGSSGGGSIVTECVK